MQFWLGTHKTNWLAETSVGLFISYGQLRARKGLPRARGPWCLDSRAFSELSQFGCWMISAKQYAAAAATYADQIGRLEWAAPQDWMCEPVILAKTGLSIAEHQARTIASVMELRSLEPRVQWIPVLQGWSLGDYLEHAEAYERAGFRLQDEKVIGVGSVCRRQATEEAEAILRTLSRQRLRLHGFGLKMYGLQALDGYMASADSMAWSFHARQQHKPLCRPTATHINCANCLEYALRWRRWLLGKVRPTQQRLAFGAIRGVGVQAAWYQPPLGL